ncbi:MAG: T9SS type A sorting domain-containing protein [Flavobacteriales bacterium]
MKQFFTSKWTSASRWLLFFVLMFGVGQSAFAQTTPAVYNSWPASYSLTSWASTNTAGTYPANMRFWRTGTQDPGLIAPTTDYVGAYNGTSGTRMNGRDASGFSFTNTGTAGNLGMAVVGLNTTGRSSVQVTWNAISFGNGAGANLTYNASTQNREYRIRLQYYVGSTPATGTWIDVPGPIEYTSLGAGPAYKLLNATETFGPTTLPVACDNVPEVYLRWSYYSAAGSAGTRPTIAVDEISISSSAAATPTIVVSSPSQIGAGTLFTGSTDQPLSNFEAAVTVANANLTALAFQTAGSYSIGDITNFKLYYNAASNTFGGASQIGSTQSSVASGGTVTFSSLTTSISSGSTGYFWITGSVAGGATAGNTINVVADPTLTFAVGTPSGSIALGGTQTFAVATPTIVMSDGGIAGGNANQNSINNVLYRADAAVSVTSATLNSVAITTAGTYAASDLVNLKLWYSTNSTFSVGTSTLLATNTTGLGAGAQSFTGLTQLFPIGTGYLYLTADYSCTATIGATINVVAPSATDFVFAAGTPSGTLNTGGTQTVVAGISTPSNVTLLVASGNGTSGQIQVSWTNPVGCYNEVLVVAAEGTVAVPTVTNTGVPTGDGSAYTAGPFGTGTALGNGFVIYKGSASPQTVSGFVDGLPYAVKVFTRYNNTWSAGIEVGSFATQYISSFAAITVTENVMPQYMQGLNGTNTNRIPCAYNLSFTGLTPSATYRYINQVVIAADAPGVYGAGNCIFPGATQAAAFTTTSSPSLDLNFGSFTADASGNYTGWFVSEPTGNATRFVPGNQVFFRIRLNDGAGGVTVKRIATTTNSAKVINLVAAAGPNDGTGIYSVSSAQPKDFICLYDNTAGSGRPLSSTFVESNGVANTASFATFYGTNVDAVAGAWGAVLPNALPNGLRRIESRAFATGAVLCSSTDADGSWTTGPVNTVNPTGGTTAIVIANADAPLNCTPLILDHTNIAQTVSSAMSISSNDNILSNFRINASNVSTTLSSISFVAGGTFNAGDVTNFDLFTSASPSFPGGLPLATVPAGAIATGGSVSFAALGLTINTGNQYFWIAADFSATGTGNTVIVPALANVDFSFGPSAIISSNTILTGGTMTLGSPLATISISAGTVAAGNVAQGAINHVLYRSDVLVGVTTTILNSTSFTSAGSYTAADVANFKLWYSTNPVFSTGTSTLLGTLNSGLGAGAHTFSPLSQNFSIGTAYLYVTADFTCPATVGASITASADPTSDYTFSSGTPTGSSASAGAQTVIAATPNNVTGLAATATGATGTVNVAWTNATGCYDEIIIVAATAANTGVPTGNGSAYTGTLVYGTGTALGNGFVVYKGSASPQVITGMTNGTPYFFKVFTRNESSWSAGIEVSATPVLTPTLTEVIVPQFMQGVNGTNANRIPYGYRVTINNLTANATYRYFNGVVIGSDASTSNGAGNAIYTNTTPNWTRTTSPGLSTAGSYGQFTTDASGSYTGWFVTEPTGNATRFVPGNQVFLRIMLNDGNNGTTVLNRVTTSSSATVVNLVASAGATNGTGIRGVSFADAKNFVCLYDNEAGTGRPISTTFVESDGTANTTANSYASFYGTNVEGNGGAWGAVIPNTLVNGIRRIEQRAFADGSIVGCSALDADGSWPSGANTVNPTGGTTAIVITSSDAALDPAITASTDPTSVSTTANNICPLTSITLSVTGGGLGTGASWEWYTGTCGGTLAGSGPSLIVSPSATTQYFVRHEGGCNSPGVCATITINVIACGGGPVNDSPATAVVSTFSGNGYPSCGTISGNTLTASNSPESPANGPDLWYSFVAQSNAVRITLNSAAMDNAISIHNSSLVLVPGAVENASSTVGVSEILNFGGLTAGNLYYVSLGGATAAGGAFTACIQHLVGSGCADGSGSYDLCTNFKPVFNGSGSYTFNFTQTAPVAGPTTSQTTPNQIGLSSAALNLRHGYTYSVVVNSTFNLVDGLGAPEVITVPGSGSCTVTIAPHADLRTKITQRCPATILKGTTLQAKPFICGAVNHTITFTEVGDCFGTNIGGLPFNATTSGSSSSKSLSSIGGVQSGKWYEVTWTPNFSYGAGTPGTTDVIYVAASSTEAQEVLFDETTEVEFSLYPNPNNGELVNFNITNITSDNVFVRVMDGMGRVVLSERYTADGSLNTLLSFARPLSNGIYMVETTVDGVVYTERMIVTK